MAKLMERLAHAWSVFTKGNDVFGPGDGWGANPQRNRLTFANERSIISSIYSRIGVDASGVSIRHVRLDDKGRYTEDISSGLNECLTVEANIDQAARAFRLDVFLTLCDKGYIAIVPVRTTINPANSSSYEINSLRVGHIVQWFPQHVRVSIYDDRPGYGRRQEITIEKKLVAIVENPLYSVMNEPNSTLQRLIRKLNMLDAVDEQSSSGKLDMLIQLPYAVQSDRRRATAEKRRKDIEVQLKGSQYGIAWIDGTEKVTQLNRPAENNLLKQVEYLTGELYNQLGLTVDVMNGTADEATMRNYMDRTINPMVQAVVEEMHRTFLTKTARTQKQAVRSFVDLFKLVPISQIAEIGDKFTRNEIMSSNELRDILGLKPDKDPKADQLRNSNMPESELGQAQQDNPDPSGPVNSNEEGASQNGSRER